jgi:amino acid adenylation domain-containing protein
MTELRQRLQGLAPAARRLLAQRLASAKATHAQPASDASVLEFFGAWVRRTPAAVAVSDGQRSLSYAELDGRANALAGQLVTAGAGAEKPVAFCLERSIESVVAMLAALKAGAAYVPLDPTQPRSRLAFILRDSAAAVLLAGGDFDSAGLDFSGRLLTLDPATAGDIDTSAKSPVAGAGGHGLAYVMYTSGSTGQPKGVCIEQRGITRLVCGTDYVEFLPTDRVAHASNPAFDAATLEVWGALLNGARLEIVPTHSLLCAEALREQIRQRQISVLFLTTALFNELATLAPDLFAGLRCLVFGGEAASLAAVRAVVAQGKPAHLVNGYGPTENTTITTAYEVGEEILEAHWRSVPIGRAINGTHVRVLDATLRPVKAGEVGELYAGGLGLARGYLNRPELDRHAFVDDPLAAGGARLYRTGDLVMLREDGNLEFVGRIDEQWKIRGFRIEPAEIQAAIERHPGVRSAVVLAREDQGGTKVLLACVQPVAGRPADCDALRAALKAQLPEHMVPAQWAVIDEWPLTSNGKIDRGALVRRAQREHASSDAVAIADAGAQTDTERHLVALVSELLDREPIGASDDFFDIGGHSLLATRLAFRVERRFGVRLPVREIFDHPTLDALARRIEELGQSGQYARTVAAEDQDAAAGDGAPLSPMQQRLWFLEQLEPGQPNYHIHQVLRLRGPLDPAALERALDLVVGRHDALRTRIVRSGERILQLVRPHVSVALPVAVLSRQPESAIDEALQRRYEALFRPVFSFEAGPLYRVELIRVGAEDHVLSWVMHHIISDGWSMNVFREELAQAYRCLVRGEPPALPELRMQYVDYARWCAGSAQQRAYGQQLEYWKGALAGMPLLDLPMDHPRPPRQDFTGAECTHTLVPALMERVRVFCTVHGVTRFMLLLAVFQLLLARWCRQTDIAVGVPAAGRNRVETEPLIGFFVNTLVMRSDLSGNPVFTELLARVRAGALDAFDHQAVPFDRLVEELHPARDLGRNPLVDVMLNVLQYEREYDFGGLNATLHMRDSVIAKFMMTFYVVMHGAKTELRLVYQAALFSAHTMQHFLDQFVALLEQVLADPVRPLAEYRLIAPADAGLLPDPRLPITEVPYASVVSRFLRCADAAPAQAALISERGTLSYRELADDARALAAWLQEAGVREGEVIAATGETGAGVFVAILAVLLAGGVVLPLDARLPVLRKRLMLEQADAQRMLVAGGDGDFLAAAEYAGGVRLHLLDPHSGLPQSVRRGDGATFRFEEPPPDAPAYIFFTSGSTGVPKAVLGCHKGLNHFIDWQIGQFGITPADRVAQLTSLSFDVLLRDLFLPLACGATLCLPSAAQALMPLGWLDEMRITVLHVVPTRANSWLADVPAGVGLQSLRWVFFAGEALSRALVEKWRAAFPRSGRIANLYGPTETTLVKSFFEVPVQPVDLVMPAGRPLPQTQLLILRDGLHLCGVGERGEIAIRTPYRSLGYRNSEPETRARFVRNPFGSDASDILYLTGDCGVYRTDGTVMMLGRLDDQVKIRGVRVEPAEVAAVLSGIEGVEGCHVGVAEDAQGEKMLVAYVVVGTTLQPDAAPLKAALEQRLPSALLPGAYVFLDALPRLPNGKIDRGALPPPGITRERHHAAPAGEVEERLAAIWMELLGVEGVGAGDDFFLLGGHSLLAMQLVLRVNELLAVELPLRSVFASPTLAGLARVIGQLKVAPPRAAPDAITPAAARRYPLSSTQQRLWFLEHLEPGGASYHIRHAWRMRGVLDTRALTAALNHVVRRHEALRTAIAIEDGVPAQEVVPALEIALRWQDLGAKGEERAEQLARRLRNDHQQPFELATPPLLRANLYRLAPREHVLLLTLHHLVTDGWSAGLINQELSHYYASELGQRVEPLPEPAGQFGDYVLWQRRRLDERHLATELAWWRDYLQGSAALDFPTDRPRPPAQSGRGGSCRRKLPVQLGRELRAFCQRRGVTLFMSLLAVFNALVYRHTGQQDFVIGTPIAGRNRLRDESVIGFFANTVLLRSRVAGQASIAELTAAARENILGVFEHQEMPFERLAEALAPERDLSRNPLFQVMFALQSAPSTSLELAGLEVEAMHFASEATKFDISFTIVDEPDGLLLHLSYSSDLFDAATMASLAAHYERLLEAALRRPEQAVATLELLSAEEAARLLRTWNDTARDFGPPRAAHGLFESQVERVPDAVAITWGTTTLSYAQVNAQANRLAHHLIARGVGPETLVGVCLERSPRMVVALLAVLKAGGAYVPLDPGYPAERLAYVLADSGATLVIGSASTGPCLSGAGEDVGVLDLERLESEVLAGYPDVNPGLAVPSSQLAYVIYTSGSTGLPKGVMIEHGAAEAFLHWMLDYFSTAERAVVLASTSLSFDVAVVELLGTLAGGGRMVLVDNVLQLIEEPVRTAGITFLNAVPSALRGLVARGAIPDSVKVICSAGEALSIALADTLLEQTSIARLVDAYGPTEDTVYSTAAERDRGGVATVGRPIPNTEAYILDADGNPVPVGVPGELYLAGRGLARGYLNRPELTAERFVELDPGGAGRKRCYRTGDRARYLPDGRIVLLGRGDHQLKIRGHRVEAGEIESVLERHPQVRRALVTTRDDAGGDAELIAYLECAETEVRVETVRQHLARWLPAYMMPARIQALPRFPLLPNGKVDRTRMPTPQAPEVIDGDEPPATETERQLAAIWRALLGVGTVGRRSNFFMLGGHSLLAMRMLSRVERQFRIHIRVVSVFESPTLAGLATCIDLHGVAGDALHVAAAGSGGTGASATEVGEL